MVTSVPRAGMSSFSPNSPYAHLAKNKGDPKDDPKDPKDDSDLDDDDEDEDRDDDTEVDENGRKTKKSKKTKKAEDKDDEDDEGDSKAAAVRQRERTRVATILNSAAGKRLPTAARRLALGGKMPRHAAVKLLRSMRADVPQNGSQNLRDRMAGVDEPDVGAGDTQQSAAAGTPQAMAAAIIAAGKKRRGEV
jgi:hypothetical protein